MTKFFLDQANALLEADGFYPSMVVTILMILALRYSRRSLSKVSLLSLPGTFAHEWLHLCVGMLVFAKPCSFSVWPKRVGNCYVLGSVGFLGIGMLNGVFVSLAPLALLPLSLFVLSNHALPAWSDGQYWWWFCYALLCGNLAFSSIPSKQDILIGGSSFVFYSGFFISVWWLFLR